MTTGAQEHIDITTADIFLEEVWAQEAIVAREQELLFATMVDRTYEDDAGIGDLIHVQARSHLSAQSKNTSSNAAVSFETVTEAYGANITIGTWSYNGIAIETATKRQVDRNMLEFYAPEQGYALALDIDDTLAGLPDDFSTNVVGALGNPLTYANMTTMRRYLRNANVPMRGQWIGISPAQEEAFLQLDQFINADYARLQGEISNAQDTAYLGAWFRVPVFVSTNIEGSDAAGHDNVWMHKSALALVLQMKATTHAQFDINYLAHKVVVEQLYGTGELRDDHGGWLKGL